MTCLDHVAHNYSGTLSARLSFEDELRRISLMLGELNGAIIGLHDKHSSEKRELTSQLAQLRTRLLSKAWESRSDRISKTRSEPPCDTFDRVMPAAELRPIASPPLPTDTPPFLEDDASSAVEPEKSANIPSLPGMVAQKSEALRSAGTSSLGDPDDLEAAHRSSSAVASFGLKLRTIWSDVHQDAVDYWASSIQVDVIHRPWETGYHITSLHSGTNLSLGYKQVWKCTVLHPGGIVRLIWNSFCLLLIIYDILIVPMQVFDVGDGDFFAWFDWLCTIFWTFDMMLMFRTGYFIGSKLEKRPAAIAMNYLRTWFPIDFATVVIEWIGRFTSIIGSASLLRTSRVLRTIRFMKLLRLAKLKNLWRTLKEQINSNVAHLCISMSIMTAFILGAIHIVSCMWYAIGDDSADGWTRQGAYKGKEGLLFWYLASARWSIAQLNGRTDMDDRRNVLEQGFTCFAGIGLAVIAKSVFTSIITKTMLDLSDLRSEQNRRRRLVNDYLERHQISAELVSSVKRYLRDYQDVDKEQKNEEQILAILPKHVQSGLLYEVRGPTLTCHPLFRSFGAGSRAALRHLCRRAIHLIPAVNKEVVFDKGDACSRMLFICEGDMTYGERLGRNDEDVDDEDSVEGGVLSSNYKVLSQGDWLSEPALWVEWTNQGRLLAENLTYLYAVEATELAQVLSRHVDVYANAVLYARTFVEQLERMESMSDIIDFEVMTSMPSASTEKKVRVTILHARGLRNADAFLMGQSDPYCICQVAGQKAHSKKTRFKTRVINNCAEPVWNQTAEIWLSSEQSLEFQIWDRDIKPLADELLGYVRLRGSSFLKNGFEGELALRGSRASGSVTVRIVTEPSGDCSEEV